MNDIIKDIQTRLAKANLYNSVVSVFTNKGVQI